MTYACNVLTFTYLLLRMPYDFLFEYLVLPPLKALLVHPVHSPYIAKIMPVHRGFRME